MKNNIADLELCILSCLLLKPELMQEIIVEDKHFVNHQKLWHYMKAFYKKFGTFDVQLMFATSNNKWYIVNFLETLLDIDVSVSNFKKYQDLLIELYNEEEGTKEKIELIYKYANDLYVRNINLNEFKEKINKVLGE